MAALIGRRLPPFRPLPPTLLQIRTYQTVAADSSLATPQSTAPPPWRPSNVLDEWVAREARPVSLRQLTFFGRSLTEERLVSSANYVRLELPTRIAHRLRNMQTLPYSALRNPHISHVHELYYAAFERLRTVPDIRTLHDNEEFCGLLNLTLNEHLSVIPRLAMGIIEIQDTVEGEVCERLMTTLLRSRISRRVIAEQHLALTETFHSHRSLSNAQKHTGAEEDFVGEIFLKCNAREIIQKCADNARRLASEAYGPSVPVPEFSLRGHLDTTFPYIPSHLEYILGELLRNSIQAAIEQRGSEAPPPIDVLICEAAHHVIIRISDQGGGVDREVLPYLWSFAKGPRRAHRLQNLGQVPRLAATMQEVQHSPAEASDSGESASSSSEPGKRYGNSLSSLTARPPGLKLGIGLPMSRIYAEYWAGSLEVHSLEGYGCDAFLQMSRLGNKNEVLSTRAAMDAV